MSKIAALVLLLSAFGTLDGTGTRTKARNPQCETCPVATVKSTAARALGRSNRTGGCSIETRAGLPLADTKCTPGAINPTVTLQVLRNKAFRTGCVRNCVTTEEQKTTTYKLYGLRKPSHNAGATQTCELDHLVPLQLGGADTLDNIWPQCGPDNVPLAQRHFKKKDKVESLLTNSVKTGAMDLAAAQNAIARDWTQFLQQAIVFCSKNPANCASGQ